MKKSFSPKEQTLRVIDSLRIVESSVCFAAPAKTQSVSSPSGQLINGKVFYRFCLCQQVYSFHKKRRKMRNLRIFLGFLFSFSPFAKDLITQQDVPNAQRNHSHDCCCRICSEIPPSYRRRGHTQIGMGFGYRYPPCTTKTSRSRFRPHLRL